MHQQCFKKQTQTILLGLIFKCYKNFSIKMAKNSHKMISNYFYQELNEADYKNNLFLRNKNSYSSQHHNFHIEAKLRLKVHFLQLKSVIINRIIKINRHLFLHYQEITNHIKQTQHLIYKIKRRKMFDLKMIYK